MAQRQHVVFGFDQPALQLRGQCGEKRLDARKLRLVPRPRFLARLVQCLLGLGGCLLEPFLYRRASRRPSRTSEPHEAPLPPSAATPRVPQRDRRQDRLHNSTSTAPRASAQAGRRARTGSGHFAPRPARRLSLGAAPPHERQDAVARGAGSASRRCAARMVVRQRVDGFRVPLRKLLSGAARHEALYPDSPTRAQTFRLARCGSRRQTLRDLFTTASASFGPGRLVRRSSWIRWRRTSGCNARKAACQSHRSARRRCATRPAGSSFRTAASRAGGAVATDRARRVSLRLLLRRPRIIQQLDRRACVGWDSEDAIPAAARRPALAEQRSAARAANPGHARQGRAATGPNGERSRSSEWQPAATLS